MPMAHRAPQKNANSGPHELPSDSIEEYKSLRSEIERRSTVQQAVVALNLTAVTVVVGLAARVHPKDDEATVLLLVPFLSYALARLWLDHRGSIIGIGAYIRTQIEPGHNLGWETYHHLLAPERARRKWA